MYEIQTSTPRRNQLRNILVAAATLLFLIPSLRGQPVDSPHFANLLMPVPAALTVNQGELRLTPDFHVSIDGVSNPRLTGAVARMMAQLTAATGLAFSTSRPPAAADQQLIIRVQNPGQTIQTPDEDESYRMTVTSTTVTLDATTVVGAMHGLQTLLQLVQPEGKDYIIPAVTIADQPRFPWRGLMIDCGRHFEPIDVIKRTLDAMAAVKMNVFHWHLTEDQGFRMQSLRFPALTAKGSDGLFYTQQQAREIVAYAYDRGIRVVPEFEMPGHSTAWLVAYPALASGTAPAGIRREFGIAPYALDPTREETYQFITAFLTEMAQIFPDPYVHIGGDETLAPDWKTNPRITAFMRLHHLKDSDALQAYFNQRILKILTTLHRRMIGWDEILNPALPRDVIVQSWRGEASLVQGAKQGYQGVLSAPYYLDAMHSAAQHYLADPLPANVDLTAEQQRLILGGEVCMWGEQLNQRTIDSRIWPRTAAIAERLWSPQNVTNVDDMYRRLEAISVELESLGLHHLSQRDSDLRQLAGSEDIAALRIFASVLEPVSFSDRYQQQKTSQTTPLDRFVDAVPPDPSSGRTLQHLVDAFLQEPHNRPADRVALTEYFAQLTAAIPAVQQHMQTSPRLQDVQMRATQLADLATLGSQAVAFASSGTTPPAGWKPAALQTIHTARQPGGIVRFTILDQLTRLINAAQE